MTFSKVSDDRLKISSYYTILGLAYVSWLLAFSLPQIHSLPFSILFLALGNLACMDCTKKLPCL